MLGSITIAYIIMIMHDIAYSVRISPVVVMHVVVQGVLRVPPPTRPSNERPPVM